MAVAREAADAQAIPSHHQAIAVMLDFVNPERAGRWPRRLRRQARRLHWLAYERQIPEKDLPKVHCNPTDEFFDFAEKDRVPMRGVAS
jgi:hypothetical protein